MRLVKVRIVKISCRCMKYTFCLFLIFTYMLIGSFALAAAPLNQLRMVPIFKDARHTVYFSSDWISEIKNFKNTYEVTVLLDFRTKSNHSGFEGNVPYVSSQTSYLINCKDESIGFRGDRTFRGHIAKGKELDWHQRGFSIIEFIPMTDLDNSSNAPLDGIDDSYKYIIKSTCSAVH